MIPLFNLSKIPKIYFGMGKFTALEGIIKNIGERILIITGAKSFFHSPQWPLLTKICEHNSVEYFHCTVVDEPSPEFIDATVDQYRDKQIDGVLAIGGGSVMDAGKAISAMLLQTRSVRDYLEGVGKGIEHDGRKVPFIAVPTTAGTGGEATKNAVLGNVGIEGFKCSLRHANFIPDIAVIDPELALCCPVPVTVACGMDAFTQLLESYVSQQATPQTDTLAFSGLEQMHNSFVPVCTTASDNIEHRTAMAYAALMSGITLAHAGLGLVHGFASSVSSFFAIPHGVICGTLLAEVTRSNIHALKHSSNNSEALKKYATVGKLFTNSDDQDENLNTLISTLDTWTAKLNIPLLSDYGVKITDIEKICLSTSHKNNPITLEQDEMGAILAKRIKT